LEDGTQLNRNNLLIVNPFFGKKVKKGTPVSGPQHSGLKIRDAKISKENYLEGERRCKEKNKLNKPWYTESLRSGRRML